MERQRTLLINAMDCQSIEKLNDVIKDLLALEDDIVPHTKADDKESHLWMADTKYYSAEIDLTVLKNKSIMTEKFSESVEAVLLYFESSKDLDGLGKMKSWMSFIETWEPGIKLAVCERCNSDGDGTVSRVTVQEWCLEHEFELVELNPDLEDYDEYEETGIKRIKNALLAHMWPNMDMKDPQQALKKAPASCAVDASKGATAGVVNAQQRIDNLLGVENEFIDENEQDNFEKLFSELKVMKDQANSLSEEERKKYAENMVKTFWTALGGDNDEFEGLSSDEDQDGKTQNKT